MLLQVTATVWRFFRGSNRLREMLDSVDRLALLLAAMCHDLEHPGTTNAFQVNMQSELAIRYNDKHVLENHHSCVASQLLLPLMKHWPPDRARVVRKLVVHEILLTDMADHKMLVGCVKDRDWADRPFDWESLDDRQLLGAFVLHTADLGNPTLPPALSQRVAGRLAQEFERQEQLEAAADLPPTAAPMVAHSVSKRADMEIGFIKFVVYPLYEQARPLLRPPRGRLRLPCAHLVPLQDCSY